MQIDEGPIYTKDNSFRAEAEAHARSYRARVLQLTEYGKYGHFLADGDAQRGYNFLPSLREEILDAVIARKNQGKGVLLSRTTGNMLSSQAMCFNLFVPLNRDKQLASRLLGEVLSEPTAIERDIAIEYTPPDSIFGDQYGQGGVDCDALIRYVNSEGRNGLIVCETKYVEKEFSTCGFRKAGHRNPCPQETAVCDDSGFCRYSSVRRYRYWDLAAESGLFRMDELRDRPCPFGGRLWQLWTNMTLAYGIAKEEGAADFRYLVICPKANTTLTDNGRLFEQFGSLLSDSRRFAVVFLENIMDKLMELAPSEAWPTEFVQRYMVQTRRL